MPNQETERRENGQVEAETQTETAAGEDTQAVDNGLPKTQAELDALIEKRLKRERNRLSKQANQQAQQPAEQSAAAPPSENEAYAAVQRELISARAQLEAIHSGIKPDLADDAVALALLAIERDGDEPDTESIREALKAVIKRHPEWKKDTQQTNKGGIKVGAGQQDGETNKGTAKLYNGPAFF